jgi:hypothetical protein
MQCYYYRQITTIKKTGYRHKSLSIIGSGISNKLTLLIILYTTIPHSTQSPPRLYSRKFTHISPSFLFLPVSGWLMAALLLPILSPTVVKSECSEMLYFYNLVKPKDIWCPKTSSVEQQHRAL